MNQHIRELKDFIAFVVLYGPDQFPEWRDITMAKAVARIDREIQELAKESPGATAWSESARLLAAARGAYSEGDPVKGAHFLQDLIAALPS
jgi:hypothetical protein